MKIYKMIKLPVKKKKTKITRSIVIINPNNYNNAMRMNVNLANANLAHKENEGQANIVDYIFLIKIKSIGTKVVITKALLKGIQEQNWHNFLFPARFPSH